MFFFNLSRYKNNMIKLCYNRLQFAKDRSSHPKVFLGKGVLKICSKFTGEHSCRSVISIKLQSNFIEITLRHGCAPVNLRHIFWYLFLRTSLGGWFCKETQISTVPDTMESQTTYLHNKIIFWYFVRKYLYNNLGVDIQIL